MGFVIDGLLFVGLIVGLLWLWSLRGSAARDTTAAQAQAQEDAKARELLERDARLHRPGVPLRCLGCNTAFLGPLLDNGCPQCHLSALVVTEQE